MLAKEEIPLYSLSVGEEETLLETFRTYYDVF